MIRRRSGDRFLLITQHDHAQLSGRIVRHYGNEEFERPVPYELTMAAVAMHDNGWPLHDDRPTLNKNNLPLDVFENPLPMSLRAWTASCERLEGQSAYTQLLVSIHVLGLSGYAATRPHTREEMFELQQFQQREVERQEELRKRLGMATDVPLKLGLAKWGASEQEDQLRRNYQVLQVGDGLSLAALCTDIIFDKIEEVVPRRGAAAVAIRFEHVGETELAVGPWPFDQERLELEVPCRSVPAKKYENVEEFRGVYEGAEVERLKVVMRKGTEGRRDEGTK